MWRQKTNICKSKKSKSNKWVEKGKGEREIETEIAQRQPPCREGKAKTGVTASLSGSTEKDKMITDDGEYLYLAKTFFLIET